MKLSSVAKYASGKAPFLGVPVFDIAEGRTITAVFRREHLQAATEAAQRHEARVEYDCVNGTLNFNSVKACCYRLVNLRARTGSIWYSGEVRRSLQAWAAGRRKSAISRALPENERKAARLALEVGKLERRRDKVRATRPHSPMLLHDYEREPESESTRIHAREWRNEKDIRRKLGQLVRRERKTWAAFYAAVAAITGHSVSESQRHDRVCNRKGGPTRVDYLTYLYKYAGLASSKPYRPQWTPFKADDWGSGLVNTFQRHRQRQIEYLTEMSERAAIQQAIDACKAEIAELTATP